MTIRFLAIAAGAASLLGASTILYAQTAPSIWKGVYSAAQAKRGEDIFVSKCAMCHGNSLEGGEAPPLAGISFFSDFSGQSVADLVDRIHTTMPADDPGKISVATATDLAAFILKFNGAPAGAADLPADPKVLASLPLEAKPK